MSPLISSDQREEYLNGRREKILDAALQAFQRNGFSATSVAEIASIAGIAKGTIYLYFESKEQIFSAILKERSFVPVLANLVDDNQTIDVTLRIIAENFMKHIEKYIPLIKMVITDGIRFPDCAEQVYQESILQSNLILADYLERQSKSGKIRPLTNPFLTAKAIIGMMMYHVLTQEIMGGKNIYHIAQEDWIEEVIRVFHNSLCPEINERLS
ncbi:MAG: TetR/AcrR family transcriptional regulator [Chloroflexi bacterium]|nr:TetR/AcrR family transcriptional regulator [Chloroflexota bacterium]